jgi:aspartate aminotransferase
MNRPLVSLPAAAAAAKPAKALNPISAGMQHSLILGIAAEVRARQAAGAEICNLTVGDFDPRQFPVPRALRDGTVAAFDNAQTNYPPAEGIPELRQAICDWYARELGIAITPDWVVVASGARPVMYATYRLFLEAGDEQLFPAPSWNASYYGQITGAKAVTVPTRAEDGFFPDPAGLPAYFRTAQLFSLNSPLNPTGTVIAPERLAAIAQALVDENDRRAREEPHRRPLMWMWDQVYWQLCFGTAKHVHPCAVVPACAPYVITVDAISKAFAATGLRVGWAVLPPPLATAMKALIGHIGAWAPKPEQTATAGLLNEPDAIAAYRAEFHAAVQARLSMLHTRLSALGIPHIAPQGAIYLSVQFALFGRMGVNGAPMRTNEDIRVYLLDKAGFAVVPFQAFEMPEESGWFRISVGAVSVASLNAALNRLEALWRGLDAPTTTG